MTVFITLEQFPEKRKRLWNDHSGARESITVPGRLWKRYRVPGVFIESEKIL